MALSKDAILKNRYRIDKLLAHEGAGAIYRGFDKKLSVAVVVKENVFQSSQSIAQFEQEALALSQLHHPNLPRVTEYFSAEDKHYLVADYVDGYDLWTIIKRQGHPLSERLGLTYLIQICEAVAYLHANTPPIIHQDIKPWNIMVNPDEKLFLVDFGMAKIVDLTGKPDARPRGVTPGFSPPEQYGRGGTTFGSDIYGLGATLYAILLGQEPPDSVTLVAGTLLTPPHQINPKLSERVSLAIMHAMEIQITDRPTSVLEWKRELQAILESLPESAEDEEDQDTLLAPTKNTKYWLVDDAGLGYKISSKSSMLGRYSSAGIVLKDPQASNHHAIIRIANQVCMVMDNGSANYTYLNQNRLSPGWHPLREDDILRIGSTSFRVTTIEPPQPSATAPAPSAPPVMATVPRRPTPEPVVDVNPELEPEPEPAPLAPAPTPSKKSSGTNWPLIVGALVLLGIAAWFFFGSGSSTNLGTPTPNLAVKTTEAQATQTAVAIKEATDAGTQLSLPTSTPVPPTNTAPAVAVANTDTPIPPTNTAAPVSNTPTNTATTASNTNTPVPPTNTATPTPTNTETTVPPTNTATDTATPTLTVTPTLSPTVALSATPTKPSGPTLIPLKAVNTVPQIGNAELLDVDINLKNPKEVYGIVKGKGIYKSSTGGDGPWDLINQPGASCLVIDPTNPAHFYACTWSAVLQSTDGGNNWMLAGNDLLSANQQVHLLTIDPTAPNIIYGGIGTALVVSTNGGQNWTAAGKGLNQGALLSIAIDPFNHDVIFAGGKFGSIYKSTDSGRNFTQLAFSVGEGTYTIVPHPTQKDVYLAGINSTNAAIIKTTNGGDFQSVSRGLSFSGAFSAYSTIVYAPSNPNIVYAGSGYNDDRYARGIFKSTDGGESWQAINNGLATSGTGQPRYVKSIAVHPTNPDMVLAATGGGLYQSSDGGKNWILK